jgi:transcriptional regulator GlxA family with amidase domain
MPRSESIRSEWLRAVLDRCQGLAIGGDADLLSAAQMLLLVAPKPETPFEALIVRGLVAEMILRKSIHLRMVPKTCASLLQTLTWGDDTASNRLRQFGHPKIRRALLTIEQSYANPDLRLRDVADVVGLTTGHLCRLLRHETDLGFVGNLKSVRLGKAEALLRLQVMSVKQVAAAVGYKYPTDFTRDFKRTHGVTPTTWRRRQVDSACA